MPAIIPQVGRAGSMLITGLVSGGTGRHKLQKRLKVVMENPENQICADCSAANPTWVCILENPVDRSKFQLGFFCCGNCATALNDLGTDVCVVKDSQSNATEWIEAEIKGLETTGNTLVNSIYEAKLDADEVDEERRKKGYMRRKYQTLKYFTKKAYDEAREKMEEMERLKEEEKLKKKTDKKSDKNKAEKTDSKKKKEKGPKEALQESVLQGSFALMEDDSTEKQHNGSSRLSLTIDELDEEPEDAKAEEIKVESARKPIRRRRSGRGLQDMAGGDPLGGNSNHARRSRPSRAGERPQGDSKRAAASHSPGPRVSRPGRAKPNDPLASQSDHIPLNRRKRSARPQPKKELVEIQWDPTNVAQSTFHASLQMTQLAVDNTEKDMAATFSKLGFEDIDFNTFVNRVAPSTGPTPAPAAVGADETPFNPHADMAKSAADDDSVDEDVENEDESVVASDAVSDEDRSFNPYDESNAAMDIDLEPLESDSEEEEDCKPAAMGEATKKQRQAKNRNKRSVSPIRKGNSFDKQRTKNETSDSEDLERNKSGDQSRKKKSDRPRRRNKNDSFGDRGAEDDIADIKSSERKHKVRPSRRRQTSEEARDSAEEGKEGEQRKRKHLPGLSLATTPCAGFRREPSQLRTTLIQPQLEENLRADLPQGPNPKTASAAHRGALSPTGGPGQMLALEHATKDGGPSFTHHHKT